MRTLIAYLIIMSFEVGAYSPTLESLFRNANNVDIGNNTVMASLIITELDPETNKPLSSEDNVAKKAAVKFVIFNEKEDRPTLTQVEYKDSSFNYGALSDVSERSFKRLSSLIRNKEMIEAKSFYSVMAMLLNNDGSFMIDFIKGFQPKAQKNQELINTRKVRLLGEYKRYLQNIKNESPSPPVNPLEPESDEKKARVKEIMSEGFLNKDPLIKRVKKNDHFAWVVQEDNLSLNFDNEHRIKDFSLKTRLGKIQYVFGKFLVFGQSFEFPEFIWFSDLQGRKYEIKASQIKIFSDNSSYLERRNKKYLEAKEKNNFTTPAYKPIFLL